MAVQAERLVSGRVGGVELDLAAAHHLHRTDMDVHVDPAVLPWMPIRLNHVPRLVHTTTNFAACTRNSETHLIYWKLGPCTERISSAFCFITVHLLPHNRLSFSRRCINHIEEQRQRRLVCCQQEVTASQKPKHTLRLLTTGSPAPGSQNYHYGRAWQAST